MAWNERGHTVSQEQNHSDPKVAIMKSFVVAIALPVIADNDILRLRLQWREQYLALFERPAELPPF